MFPLFVLAIIFRVSVSYKDGLYSTEDEDVMVLNNESFKANVLSRKSATVWVVQFYNSWCGHCIKFSPTWKRVAVDFKDWQDVVVIAAMDCSQARNLESCRANNINSYPTMKMFPSIHAPGGQVQEIESQQLEVIKLAILGHLSNNLVHSWPSLEPLEKITDLWHKKRDHQKVVLVVFEDSASTVGMQVIIDVRNVSDVLIGRMLKEKAASYGIITMFPSLYRVDPGSLLSLISIGSKMEADDRLAFVRVVKHLVEQSDQGLHNEDSVDSSLTSRVHYNSSVVSMQDMESTLHYMLRQEVSAKSVIQGEELTALRSLLKVLVKYFPGRKCVQGFLRKVSGMLAMVRGDSLTGEEWLRMINGLQDQESFLPKILKWECCQGSAAGYRGYPCGMWRLFHALTVAAYSQNKNKGTMNPQRVLTSIQGYMRHFFGCQECTSNFLFMSRSMGKEVQGYADSILWLWRAHNKANIRLHGDASEDPMFPKIEFPPLDMCPKCHIPVPEDSGMHLSWDENQVLEFLSNFYSAKNLYLSDSLQVTFDVLNSSKSAGDGAVSGYHSESKIKNLNLSQEKLQQGSHRQAHDGNTLGDKLQQGSHRQAHVLDGNTLGDKLQQGSHRQTHMVDGNTLEQDSQTEQSKAEPGLTTWGLTHFDLSMCVVFYLISTVTLIILYHHFVVRRHKIPCRAIKAGEP